MIQSLNLVFCGTPRFAVPTLDRLVDAGFRIQLVVTQPDRPKGRGLELVPSPIKERALQLGLPIVQPESIKNNADFRARLAALKPDAIIIVGYGRIIPQWMLDLPPLGNLNLHASLLPKYRGAAPIQWAIAQGETVTGVTTMKIDAGLDTGDILLQQDVPIARTTPQRRSLRSWRLWEPISPSQPCAVYSRARFMHANRITLRPRSRPSSRKKTASSISPARRPRS